MDNLPAARDLVRSGRYREALATLDRDSKRGSEVLRAELLERAGLYGQCKALIERLQRTKLSQADLAICEFLIGQIAWESNGDSERALTHLRRALSLAEAVGDQALTCSFELRLLIMLADQAGPTAVAPLLMRLRRQVLKLGDPQLSAALHIFVGETDAKRGLRQSAERHSQLGLRLLGTDDNLWLRAVGEIVQVANCIMASDIDSGIRHAESALALAEASGAAAMKRASLGNLGNLYYLAGHFDLAIEYLRQGQDVTASTGERFNAASESIARVLLALDRTQEARECYEQIVASMTSEADWSLYGNRHSRLGLGNLLLREGRVAEATECINHARTLAEQAGDHLLEANCRLAQLDICRHGSLEQLIPVLDALVPQLPNHPPELFAQYERIVGAALLTAGSVDAGRAHFDRARRWYSGLHNVPGLIEVDRTWKELSADAPAQIPGDVDPVMAAQHHAGNLVQNVAALMMQAGRPELLAPSLVAILADTGAAAEVTAQSRAEDGTIEILAAYHAASTGSTRLAGPSRTVGIGTARHRTVELVVRPYQDVESAAVLNAMLLLLGAVKDIERAHAEREDQLALWPIEELPIEGENAVVGGCLHELLSFARKVGRTNASVLVTGESGTGKEILARAIHGYSTRANRPFVPFNCTAIPREMLESQLFGYKRGAFTGADRDNPGLIRAAKSGTLFLDEVGEMSLDLQPKLLRFLESGEISPLGEEPSNVDVRIVAATNRNLEQLVQEGRFREDLYYRLNVIKLPIPPLRERRDEIPALVHHFVQKTAGEFSKGRIRVADETMEHLVLFAWPGNIRQMQNEIRRMVALIDVDGVLKPSALSPDIRRATARPAPTQTGSEVSIAIGDKLAPTISRIEKEMIRSALRTHHGRVEAAAKALGISRKGLYLKRQRLGL